ncbi:glycosyltransferase [Hymenobacter glaciei]|uniref:Glycosyltransferase n=1 Tax=Hymenobacter glaciei TaxID=877209 RepID=A0ABP7UHJ4_9BACT
MHKDEARPLVSVCCITYNHAAFLAQAIESVLAQEAPFAIELVIGEDCSTDDTRRIALDYERRFPQQVRVLPAAPNRGIMPNLMATLATCTGRYIALLDGDDYWTDPHKLQQQVAVLEAQPGCALCVHDAEAFVEDGAEPPYLFSTKYSWLPRLAGPISQGSLVRFGWGIPTASMLFRRERLVPLPGWFRGVFSGDYTLQLLCSQVGYVYYLPRVMSRYRLHAGGVSRPTNNSLAHNRKRIFETRQLQRRLPAHYHPVFAKTLEELYFQRSALLGVLGNRRKQLAYLWQALNVDRSQLPRHLARIAKKLVRGLRLAA